MNDSCDEALYHLDCRVNYVLKKKKSIYVSDFHHIEELINLEPSRICWTSIELFEIYISNKNSHVIQENLKQDRKYYLKNVSKYFSDKIIIMHVNSFR